MNDAKRERRSLPRHQATTQVTIKSRDGKSQATGSTRDLSLNGVFLYTNSPMRPGTDLELILILPPALTQGEKRWVCCSASIVRVEENDSPDQKSLIGVAARIRSMEILPEIQS